MALPGLNEDVTERIFEFAGPGAIGALRATARGQRELATDRTQALRDYSMVLIRRFCPLSLEFVSVDKLIPRVYSILLRYFSHAELLLHGFQPLSLQDKRDFITFERIESFDDLPDDEAAVWQQWWIDKGQVLEGLVFKENQLDATINELFVECEAVTIELLSGSNPDSEMVCRTGRGYDDSSLVELKALMGIELGPENWKL